MTASMAAMSVDRVLDPVDAGDATVLYAEAHCRDDLTVDVDSGGECPVEPHGLGLEVRGPETADQQAGDSFGALDRTKSCRGQAAAVTDGDDVGSEDVDEALWDPSADGLLPDGGGQVAAVPADLAGLSDVDRHDKADGL